MKNVDRYYVLLNFVNKEILFVVISAGWVWVDLINCPGIVDCCCVQDYLYQEMELGEQKNGHHTQPNNSNNSHNNKEKQQDQVGESTVDLSFL